MAKVAIKVAIKVHASLGRGRDLNEQGGALLHLAIRIFFVVQASSPWPMSGSASISF